MAYERRRIAKVQHGARCGRREVLARLGFVSLWLMTACSAPADLPRHLVVIVVDTLRADALGVYGNDQGVSPHMDALAGQSVVFDHAWAQGTYTPASYMSYMTSTHVRTHGWDYALNVYPKPGVCGWDDLTTLPEVLAEAGFTRTALVANPYLHPKRGFPRGFERWNDIDVPALREGPELSREDYAIDDEAVVAGASSAMAGWSAEQRHFLYLHLMSPHLPLKPSAEARRRVGLAEGFAPDDRIPLSLIQRWRKGSTAEQRELTRRAYHASVWDGDAYVGEILAALEASGHGGETAVVLMSDHGEELWEHDDYGHQDGVWDALVRVPLLIRAPGLAPVRVADRPVALLDVAPTLLRLLGIGVSPDSWQGRDLLAPDAGRPVVAQRFAELAVSRDGVLKGVTQTGVGPGSLRFFDLGSDPSEQLPRAAADGGETLVELLADWAARTPEADRDDDAEPVGICSTLTRREQQQLLERLRALGYAD